MKYTTYDFFHLKTQNRKEIQQENATRCNNRDDLLYFTSILEILIFSEVYIWPSRKSMMELLLQK